MHKPDFERFRAAMLALAKVHPPKEPLDDAMIQAYWNALKDLPIEIVETRAKSHERHGKFWPKPYELRPPGEKRQAQDGPQGDHIRDHWRSQILNDMRESLGLRFKMRFDVFVARVASSPLMSRAVVDLLNELCEQEKRDGRTHGMELGCRRRSEQIARAYALPEPAQQATMQEAF